MTDAALLKVDGSFERVEVDGLSDYYRLIDCQMIELLWETKTGVDLYCDEEFLLTNDKEPNAWTSRFIKMGYHGNKPYGIHGNIIAVRHDDEGETESLTQEDYAMLEALARGEVAEL